MRRGFFVAHPFRVRLVTSRFIIKLTMATFTNPFSNRRACSAICFWFAASFPALSASTTPDIPSQQLRRIAECLPPFLASKFDLTRRHV